MNAKTVRDTIIKPKLVEIFGVLIANSLLSKATLAGIRGETEKDKLQLMVDCICTDPKVKGMWGNAQTLRQKEEWLNNIQ